ncbi:MAG TPA: FixH family protein [Polyangiaceae bacterium]|jgi:nitrogen fixation protein FixH|nr:FixH family protein [Polyangiaceae bacterium]
MTTGAQNHWAYVPIGMIAAMLLGLGSLARIAVNDPGFAVEKDYYKKALSWDGEMAQQADNQRLGWQTELDVDAFSPLGSSVTIRIRDGKGEPVRGAAVQVEAFPNARASELLHARFEALRDGNYRAQMPLDRSGLWEFRVSAQSGDDHATAIVRRDVVKAR